MNKVKRQAQALVDRMTLEEKVAQMVQVPCNMVTFEEAKEWARRGAGSFLHVLGDEARELQRIACATRMGIPVLFGIDAVHGHCLNNKATIYPSQLALACTWSRHNAYQMARETAREVAADGLHWTFSPLFCLSRDPRWGRVNETFGEDPYLTGEMGAAMVKGYQGDDLNAPDSILACAKHYLAYGEATGARDSYDSSVTMRKVREVMLPPFAKAIEAGCATVMTAYGSLDGTPCTLHKELMTGILRDELGFEGMVVTDWDNVQSLVSKQFVCETIDEASAQAAEAGNDMIMTSLGFYEAALRMVRAGKLSEAVIDRAVERILALKICSGLMEHPEKDCDAALIGCAAHRETALKLARESLVLLKNNGMLPLRAQKIAVIGPNADDIQSQYGDWTYFTHPTPDPTRPAIRPYVTLLEGMRASADQHGVQIRYAKGCGVLPDPEDDALMEEALQIAAHCDAVVFAAGDHIDLVGEYKDRADLMLSGRQLELYERLKALRKPVCVVLIASKPLCLGAAGDADAILAAFNGGMYSGQAIAEAIFGDVNPCGKLPISFPRHSGQVPVYYNTYPGWHGDKYADLPGSPLFAFGEGLSYTTFAIDEPQFDREALRLSLKVANTGSRDGSTVIQVYFKDCVSSVLTPVRQLIAFERIDLKAGEAREVAFRLSRDDFSLVNREGKRVTEPGDFVLMVGTSSKDEDLMCIPFRLE